MSDWEGQPVSIECRDLGVFQGLVQSVDADSSTITLSNVFKDGRPCSHNTVSILSSQIKELKFIEAKPLVSRPERNTRVESSDDDRTPSKHKPGKKKPAKVVRAQTMIQDSMSGGATRPNAVQRRRSNSCTVVDPYSHGHNSPGRPDQPRHVKNRSQQNKADCFDVTVESCMGDFDFEKNLAMFDKQRVYDEIENNPNSRLTPKKTTEKYKHDEMVIKNDQTVQQIKFVGKSSEATNSSYVTDDGLVIPCITFDMRETLFKYASTLGLTDQRRVDMVGRNTSDMIFQLIGGSNRLNPQNSHQKPTVVVFCAPHIQGCYGINCARHLANHNVKTVLFIPTLTQQYPVFSQELDLYNRTGNIRIERPEELPTGAIDLIINCLDSQHVINGNMQPWYKYITNWCNTSRAHVLSIDPPDRGDVQTKWSVHVGLPLRLTRSTGHTYLCDIGLPRQIFNYIGLKYQSPFGIKFCIPLHSQ